MSWSWSDINYWAVLVAMVAFMIIGSLWYSQMLFGKKWLKYLGMKREDMNGSWVPILWAAVLSFIISLSLAVLMQMSHGDNFGDCFMIGIYVSILVAAILGNDFIFNQKKFPHYLITAGYYVVSILAASAIIAAWM